MPYHRNKAINVYSVFKRKMKKIGIAHPNLIEGIFNRRYPDNLQTRTNVQELSDNISQSEVLITDSLRPKLHSLLLKLQERLQKELNVQYVWHQSLEHHNLPIASVDISKDGTKCITGSFDNTCKVWDVSNGSVKYTINSHTAPVYAVTLNHPYGDLIVTGSFDKSTRITNMETGQCLKTLWGHTDEIVVVKYDSNDNLIATASMDKTAKVYSAEKGELLWTIASHEEPIVSLQFSSDGRNILTGSFDSNIYLWDVRMQRKVASFVEHTEEVSSCVLNFDCSLIGSGSVDKTAKIWDLRSDESIITIYHEDEVLDINFDYTGRKFVTAGNDGIVKVSDISQGEGKPLSTLLGHSKEVSKVCFSPGGGLILTGSADGTCRLWESETGYCVQIFTQKDDIFTCLFSYDGSIIASAGSDHVCTLWKESHTYPYPNNSFYYELS